jgi:hypothetical protein
MVGNYLLKTQNEKHHLPHTLAEKATSKITATTTTSVQPTPATLAHRHHQSSTTMSHCHKQPA